MCKLLELFVGVALLAHRGMSTDVIYKLSKEDYARMPVMVHTDRFANCLNQPGGVFCTAGADVVADGPSELLDMMRAYSAQTVKHFNYTQLSYGMCMTRTCRAFYNGTSERELQVALEACLNDTLSRDYGLKTRITKMSCYFEDQTKNNRYTVDWVDWAAGALLFAIIALNVVGSVYDTSRDQTKLGNKVLLSFSWRRNWKQLLQPPSADPRAAELQSINGVRFLTCIIVVMIHVLVTPFWFLEDTKIMEERFDNPAFYALFQLHYVTQSFILMSGFLLVYNMQISNKERTLTWKTYVKSIALRYVRLSSISLVAVTWTATLMRFSRTGPLWQDTVGVEVDDCRNHYIYNFLLAQNYVNFSTCGLTTWSLAVDFHLHILGLTVMLLAPSAAWRRAVLAILFVVGHLLPMYTVVSKDVDGILLNKPEFARFSEFDRTFDYVYRRSHNNTPVFIIGMTLGYIVFDLQKRKVTTRDHTEYRFLYWLLLPLMVAVLHAPGQYFYKDEPRASLQLHLLFTFAKSLYGLIVMFIILGAVLKVESLYRSVLEWRGFVPLAKLSYCMYTLHIIVVRYSVGDRSTLFHISTMHEVEQFYGSLVVIMALSFVVYMAVEAPVTHLSKMALAEPRPPLQQDKENKTE